MKSIFKLVKTEYERRHKHALRKADQRKAMLIKDHPDLKQAYNDMASVGVKYSKQVLNGSISTHEANIKTELEFRKLSKNINELLLQKGYSDDYLNINFFCSKCKDTGFIENGKKRCSCYSETVKYIMDNDKDYKIFKYQNFDIFNQNLYSPKENPSMYGIKKSPRAQILAIKDKCFDFIESFDRPDTKNLLFTGNTGLGKTFMSNCVAYELLLKGYSVCIATAPMFFETTSGFLIDREQYMESYEFLQNSNLLVIDDMGTEKLTDSRYAQLLNILETKKRNDLSFPCKIIMITNSSINELYSTYSERIASRIAGDFSAIKFVGNDIRIINKEGSMK